MEHYYTFLIIGLAIGIGIGLLVLFIQKKKQSSLLKGAENKAKLILSKANEDIEILKKEKMLEAREKLMQIKNEQENELKKREQNISRRENELKQKSGSLQGQQENLNRKEKECENQKNIFQKQTQFLKKKEEELDELKSKQVAQLETIAGLDKEEAVNRLLENLRSEAKSKIMVEVKEMEDEARRTASKEAKKIIIQTIQRTAIEGAIDNMISSFNIENNEVKGRIIGREGRNIKALEKSTGVEIIVDDTPETITISCFDPVRREIARLSLHRLVTDGRIHPARIEEVVAKTRKDIEEEIIEIGERTVMDLGIRGLHPELVRMVGRMRYRSSYGQNLLHHSKEVSRFCTIMAAELGLKTEDAKRAGLLHDIGKVADTQPDLPHAILGMNLAEKYKENPIVCNAIGAHHEEIEMKSSIAHIVQACDAISGIRPGARRDVVESYIKRLSDMEAIAMSYEGVEKTFAIQAGRELRVIVESDKIDDATSAELAAKISTQIQEELTYPGQIKVAVVRETRSIAIAK